jgi:ribosomal protein S18 acetylase RimI-like enzyme
LSGSNQSQRPPTETQPPDGAKIRVVAHRARGLRLRWLPGQLDQVQRLLDQHSFWAAGRSTGQLRRMLAGSQAVVSAWDGHRLVGFGRASSDGVFRAVLWDVVVAGDHQGQGLGRRLVAMLLEHPALAGVERVYLMTTNGAGFYRQLGFEAISSQQLMLRRKDGAANG